jgi:predicted  nucleic acid-binding Zn-ribbon protein
MINVNEIVSQIQQLRQKVVNGVPNYENHEQLKPLIDELDANKAELEKQIQNLKDLSKNDTNN